MSGHIWENFAALNGEDCPCILPLSNRRSQALVGYMDAGGSEYIGDLASNTKGDVQQQTEEGPLQTFDFKWSRTQGSPECSSQGVLLHASLVGKIVQRVLAKSQAMATRDDQVSRTRAQCVKNSKKRQFRNVYASIQHGLTTPRNRVEQMLHRSYNVIGHNRHLPRRGVQGTRINTRAKIDCEYSTQVCHSIRLNVEILERTILLPLWARRASSGSARNCTYLRVSRLDTTVHEEWETKSSDMPSSTSERH